MAKKQNMLKRYTYVLQNKFLLYLLTALLWQACFDCLQYCQFWMGPLARGHSFWDP